MDMYLFYTDKNLTLACLFNIQRSVLVVKFPANGLSFTQLSEACTTQIAYPDFLNEENHSCTRRK
jgi:hypothetical protein